MTRLQPMRASGARTAAALLVAAFLGLSPSGAAAQGAWPMTDFSKRTIDLGDVISGGVPRDGIRSIDGPRFSPARDATGIAGTEPVIGLVVGQVARAYPLRILTRHEIVNDVIAGVPVAVTFCPLCNTGIVFKRTVQGRVLEFGVTGLLRNSDLIMYDRQTESWWQQFTGEAIVGAYAGTALDILPARLESWDNFRKRAPHGEVLVVEGRSYGINPYPGYDTSKRPFLFMGALPDEIAPLARVVSLTRPDGAKEGWSLDRLRADKRIEAGDLVITWEPRQNSALDHPLIASGLDVGNVVVQRRTPAGLEDYPYTVDFAFAFRAFHPDAPLHQ